MLNKDLFIEFLLKNQALKFGDYTLKSGRQSPYFFNLGLFNTGESLTQLGKFYAAALLEAKWEYEVLFGPAYKGIPLVATTCVALYEDHQVNAPFAFNRKEVKDHGESGQIVGTSLQNKKVVMLDDVITAGTTVRETLALLKEFSAQLNGILIAFDRQERGEGALTATQEVGQHYGIPIISILKLSDIIVYLSKHTEFSEELARIKAYQEQYGI